MFIDNLLDAVTAAGLAPSIVLSYLTVPSFPTSKRLWIPPESLTLDSGMPTRQLPFLNVTPLKQVAIGISAAAAILRWGRRHRTSSKKLVWVFNLSVPPIPFILAAARLIGAKVLVSLNDINEPGHTVSNRWIYRLDYSIQKAFLPRLDGYIAVADRMMTDLLPGRRYLRVEGGVTDQMLGLVRSPSPGPASRDRSFTVTAAGSLDEANGIPELLEAFTLLSGREVRLCILGDGPLKGLVSAAAAVNPQIEYAGVLPLSDLLEVYRKSDVLVNMRITKRISTRYFFPSKLMEYLASGVPVITTCTGHVEEEFGQFCILLREETPQALAAAIERVMEMRPNERSSLGLQARAYMAAEKTWQLQGERIVRYIRETVFGSP